MDDSATPILKNNLSIHPNSTLISFTVQTNRKWRHRKTHKESWKTLRADSQRRAATLSWSASRTVLGRSFLALMGPFFFLPLLSITAFVASLHRITDTAFCDAIFRSLISFRSFASRFFCSSTSLAIRRVRSYTTVSAVEEGPQEGSGSGRGDAWTRVEAVRRAETGGGKGGTPGVVAESDAAAIGFWLVSDRTGISILFRCLFLLKFWLISLFFYFNTFFYCFSRTCLFFSFTIFLQNFQIGKIKFLFLFSITCRILEFELKS